MENENRELKRLQVFMASCGVGSRRTCEQFIAEKRVAINGRTVTTQGEKVDPAIDVVELDGKRLRAAERKIYLALNKPPGYICTSRDPSGRPLVVDLLGSIAKKNRLFSVGRLDFMSSGLIFYTNDGEFARAVAHPSSGIEKEYLIETRKPVGTDIFDQFKAGVLYNGVRYRISKYTVKTSTQVLIGLLEGKNRELRNMFAAKRVQIRKIHRVRIGAIPLGKLRPGEFRFLSRAEVDALSGKQPAGTPREAPRTRRADREAPKTGR